MTDNKPALRMTTLAGRSLTEEIAALRNDIHQQAIALNNIDLMLVMLFQQLRNSNLMCADCAQRRSPDYFPPAEE